MQQFEFFQEFLIQFSIHCSLSTCDGFKKIILYLFEHYLIIIFKPRITTHRKKIRMTEWKTKIYRLMFYDMRWSLR